MAWLVPLVIVNAPSSGNAAETVGGIVFFAVPTYLCLFYFAAKVFEYIRISSDGVEICSPLWWNQRYGWDEILGVKIQPDIYTFIPTMETAKGTVKLRAAASLTGSPRSAAGRVLTEIEAHLDGRDGPPPGRADD